jgi:hypothetical protein
MACAERVISSRGSKIGVIFSDLEMRAHVRGFRVVLGPHASPLLARREILLHRTIRSLSVNLGTSRLGRRGNEPLGWGRHLRAADGRIFASSQRLAFAP